jgi:hypothetical protein
MCLSKGVSGWHGGAWAIGAGQGRAGRGKAGAAWRGRARRGHGVAGTVAAGRCRWLCKERGRVALSHTPPMYLRARGGVLALGRSGDLSPAYLPYVTTYQCD